MIPCGHPDTWANTDTFCVMCQDDHREARARLARVIDYCSGMLAALDADDPDVPARDELLDDVLRKATA